MGLNVEGARQRLREGAAMAERATQHKAELDTRPTPAKLELLALGQEAARALREARIPPTVWRRHVPVDGWWIAVPSLGEKFDFVSTEGVLLTSTSIESRWFLDDMSGRLATKTPRTIHDGNGFVQIGEDNFYLDNELSSLVAATIERWEASEASRRQKQPEPKKGLWTRLFS